MKKLICLLMTLLMIVTVLPLAALAEGEEPEATPAAVEPSAPTVEKTSSTSGEETPNTTEGQTPAVDSAGEGEPAAAPVVIQIEAKGEGASDNVPASATNEGQDPSAQQQDGDGPADPAAVIPGDGDDQKLDEEKKDADGQKLDEENKDGDDQKLDEEKKDDDQKLDEEKKDDDQKLDEEKKDDDQKLDEEKKDGDDQKLDEEKKDGDQKLEEEQKEDEKTRKIKKKTAVSEAMDWLRTICIGVLAGVLLVVFVVQRDNVYGDSMNPTLESGDVLFTQKISTYFKKFDRGDIVVLDGSNMEGYSKSEYLIKRIVGLPGETVKIADGCVYIKPMGHSDYYILQENYLAR